MKTITFNQQEDLYSHAAELFTRESELSIKNRGRFITLLSGGGTPLPLYRLLATNPWRSRLDWERIFVGWSDERCVSPHHDASNYRGAMEALLAHVPIPKANILRIEGEGNPEAAANAYELGIRSLLGEERGIDLAVLGLGSDGHTASLFPEHPALEETEHWFVPVHNPLLSQPWRVTASLPLLNSSRKVVFLVTGQDKADAFARVRRQEWLPATLVQPKESAAIWLVSKTALGPSLPHRQDWA